jgi:hypothetical protein
MSLVQPYAGQLTANLGYMPWDLDVVEKWNSQYQAWQLAGRYYDASNAAPDPAGWYYQETYLQEPVINVGETFSIAVLTNNLWTQSYTPKKGF